MDADRLSIDMTNSLCHFSQENQIPNLALQPEPDVFRSECKGPDLVGKIDIAQYLHINQDETIKN